MRLVLNFSHYTSFTKDSTLSLGLKGRFFVLHLKHYSWQKITWPLQIKCIISGAMHCNSWSNFSVSSNRPASRCITSFKHLCCKIFWVLNWLSYGYVKPVLSILMVQTCFYFKNTVWSSEVGEVITPHVTLDQLVVNLANQEPAHMTLSL